MCVCVCVCIAFITNDVSLIFRFILPRSILAIGNFLFPKVIHLLLQDLANIKLIYRYRFLRHVSVKKIKLFLFRERITSEFVLKIYTKTKASVRNKFHEFILSHRTKIIHRICSSYLFIPLLPQGGHFLVEYKWSEFRVFFFKTDYLYKTKQSAPHFTHSL